MHPSLHDEVHKNYLNKFFLLRIKLRNYKNAKVIINVTYDFQLVFCCNYVSILHRFRDIIRFSVQVDPNLELWIVADEPT